MNSEHYPDRNDAEIALSLGKDGFIHVDLPPKSEWIQRIRKVPNRKWDVQRKIWLIPDNPEMVKNFCYYFEKIRLPSRTLPCGQNTRCFARY